MESPLDIALVAALVAGAGAYAIWRFGFARKKPDCAPGEGKPQVMVGGNLGRAMKKRRSRA